MNGITKTKSRITTLQTILSVVVPVAIIIYLVGQGTLPLIAIPIMVLVLASIALLSVVKRNTNNV